MEGPARRLVPLVAGLLAVLAPGGPAAGFELWPLVVGDERPVAGIARRRAAGPLFESFELADGTRGWMLRPLLGGLEAGGRSRLEFLYPLGAFQRGEPGWSLRVTPLLDIQGGGGDGPEAADGTGTRRSAWTVGPAFGGRTPQGQRYGGLFPLGGVARERFGLARLDFWLFPLFARARHRDGFERTYLLWPFLSWGHGGGRRLLRIWPFYGHDVKQDRFERRFAIWPLVHWRNEDPGGPGQRQVRLFLPFYGESRSARARSQFVLGPLHLASENQQTGERSRAWLWPLVRFARRPARDGFAGSRELRVEPFVRRVKTPGSTRTRFALGAVERYVAEDDDGTRSGWRLLWISRFAHERRADASEGWKRDLWPVFRYRAEHPADAPPRGRLTIPWLLPVGGEGFQRHWLDAVTVYERRWSDAESRNDWLWGLVRSQATPSGVFHDVAGVLRWERPRADAGAVVGGPSAPQAQVD